MSDYQLIAFDMDGTLLNSQKEISPACIHWIHQAALAGKTVILNTGRCPAELEEYFALLPDLTYVNCVSGALVYNHATKETIYSRTLPVDTVKKKADPGSETGCRTCRCCDNFPGNLHKGIGLSRLCEYLHIPLSQTIVVGDADNDAAVLEAAGLPVAMANANDRIKALADVITMQDNDHDGCAEVIQKYLLS